MIRTHRHLVTCMLLGCTGQPSDGTATTEAAAGESGAGNSETGETAHPTGDTRAPAIPLARGLGHDARTTEVWLDARASSALTLDARGDVRLWPQLPPAQTDLAALPSIRVPVREPLWLSHARAGDGSFIVASIDTAQIARVFEIQLDQNGSATFRTLTSTSPHDPLLELHVLDGGQRLLALGVDHRIRLYDVRGELLSELTEYGLAPWQLRLAGTHFAMVLAGPTRLQRFTITDDRLAKQGEPRAFTLDRGPNHNDLELLPSGRVAAVLRRPNAKGPQWSIELHDLDSGEVRVLWGEVEAKWRPRLHIVDDERALLEDGIAGYWIDLRQAVLMPAPFELPEKLEDLPPETHVAVRRVVLPGTTQEIRMHTGVVAGIRTVPFERGLLLDPVDGDRHHRLGHTGVSVRWLDFEAAGDLLAVLHHDQKLAVESLAQGNPQTVECPTKDVFTFQFVDADHLLLVGPKQAQLCAWRTSQVVATLELPDIERIAVHPTGPGAGEIGLRKSEWIEGADEPKITLSHASYSNNQFSAITPLEKAEFERWPEFEEKWEIAVVDAAGNRYLAKDEATRKLAITLASGERRELTFVEPADPKVDIEQLDASPDGRFIALLTTPHSRYEGYGYGYSSYGSEDPDTLSIWAIANEPPELRWSTITSSSFIELAWTDDGSKFAVEDGGRLRVITNNGEVIIDRTSRDFRLEELPDEPVPSPNTPAQ